MQKLTFRNIDKYDAPFWIKGEFIVNSKNIKPKDFIGREVGLSDYIDQHSDVNFQEFEELGKNYGFSGEKIRKCACGISTLHMVLRTLSRKYILSNKTVGGLALEALSFHRDDLVVDGNIVKVGTPVLKNPPGWYHDALIFMANQYGVKGVRYENISLEELSGEMSNLKSKHKELLAIISLIDTYIIGGVSNISHLIVVNGIKVESGIVTKIRVVDSSPGKNKLIINRWVDVTDWVRDCYLNRAMIFTQNV